MRFFLFPFPSLALLRRQRRGGRRRQLGLRRLGLPEPVAAVDLEEHGAEDHDDADDAGGADGVGVDEAAEDDGHGLAQRHDDDERHRAELRDGVVDEELADGGAHGQDHAVEREHGELQDGRERG